jgi:hypothetical protein
MSQNELNFARATSQGDIRAWAVKDYIAAAAVLSRALCIGMLPYFPISPIVILSFLFFLVCFKDMRRSYKALKHCGVLIAYLALIGMQVLGIMLSPDFSFDYDSVSEIGRIISAAAFVIALVAYIASNPAGRFKRVLALTLYAMGASALWFLLEISISEPFVGLRLELYADNYLRYEWNDEGEATRSGLCPFLHILGYQLSFLVSILLVTESKYLTKPNRILRLLGLLLGAAALYFSSQRSVFFAGAATVFLFMFYSSGRRISGRMVGLLLFIATIVTVTTSLEGWETDYLQASISQKLFDSQHWDEARFRLNLQLQALVVIINNPLGLADPFAEWIQLGFWPVYEAFESPPFNTPIAVHNGYLGQALDLGAPFLAITICFLWGIVRMAHRNLLKSANLPSKEAVFTRAVAASVPGIFLLQSTTHNSSVLTADASCLIIFSLLLTMEIQRLAHVPRPPRSSAPIQEQFPRHIRNP